MQSLHRSALFVTTICIFAAPKAWADSKTDTQVTVFVQDGRVLNGHVDVRTDEEVLWIRLSRGDVTLATGLSWDLIEEVRAGDKRFSAAEFHSEANSYASSAPKPATSTPAKVTARSSSIHWPNPPGINRVSSLQLDASIANWDRDAESDGIALRILPLAIDGRPLAVDGVISVELLGREFVDRDRDEVFPTLGQWSQRVRATDFRGFDGAVYQLPTHQPLDDDQSLLSIGMVRVELTVLGQGHFDAVVPVRLRSYNPIRDQMDQYDSRRDSFGRYRARHW